MIAEEFAKILVPGKIDVYSSSFEPGTIGSLPITIMKEVGIDLPRVAAKSVFNRYKDKEVFDYVITLCHKATTEQCPVFMTNVDTLYAKKAERLSWSVPDFITLKGTEEEKKIEARKIRDLIKENLLAFLSQIGIKVNKS